MKVKIETAYLSGNTTEVELPEGREWKDVKDWYVKWGILHITFKDGESFEQDLGDDIDVYSTKHPHSAYVFDEDDNKLDSRD